MNNQLKELNNLVENNLIDTINKWIESELPNLEDNPLQPKEHRKQRLILGFKEASEAYKKRVQKGYEVIVDELQKGV
jgi:hypothetical protein